MFNQHAKGCLMVEYSDWNEDAASEKAFRFLSPTYDGGNIRPNGQIIVGDGTRTHCSEEITADTAHSYAITLLRFETEARRRTSQRDRCRQRAASGEYDCKCRAEAP
mgnify:CR=1 FL=1